ncbi:FKBP-type peptidyl-prolyl cis-trans isomerase [Vibrio sp. S4M6]|uniref:FKBP-type peptidyl-prolyl cis-trans isomerase n=1 Tax=Vibrio sinus TaxID=2946865 RepID=UPI002029BBD4|nr:FKBP-type peptidyl-prolyl cis-trans isomerase [Vibrio sinus]MCL9779929.1 FKBP-type peptidyl-prolyl cis-trans isomerase [Vibrio sinus]
MNDVNIVLAIVLVLLLIYLISKKVKNRKSAGENLEKGKAFLEQNASKEGVIVTKSGLQYQILKEGVGQVNPHSKSNVKVHYHGTLIDGTVFDSSVDRGQPISFRLNQVIKGWREGLQYMVEGEKIRMFIPPHLAYGSRGARTIPAASTLIFDVELIEIK